MEGVAIIRRCPRISPAENGLILSWTEYMPSTNAFDGMSYIGEKQKVFTMSEEDSVACIKELVSIYKEDTKYSVAANILKDIKRSSDND